MTPKALAGIACACAVAGTGLFLVFGPDRDVDDVAVGVDGDAPAAEDAPAAAAAGEASPFATADSVDAGETESRDDPGADIDRNATGAPGAGTVAAGKAVPLTGPVDLQLLGREPMSEEAFDALLARLDQDPALLAALIQELRGETDAARIERLSLLLGDLDHPDVTALAVELAYGADPALRAAGLDLLKRTGDGNLAERDAVVSGLLSTETDPELLRSALTAIARPGNVDESARASMATQVALLADHEDAGVRLGSIEIVSRWTRDGSDTPVLLGGLTDEDASVRRAAAYAFVGHEAIDDDVRRELMRVVEDDSEARETRSAALLALRRSGSGDAASRTELDRLQRRLDGRERDDRSG